MSGSQLMTVDYQNPHASTPLVLPVVVFCNTPDDVMYEHIRINTAKDLPWLKADKEHGDTAIMVGGGPSAADCIDDIRALASLGHSIFAMNNASRWLRQHGIEAQYQVICDAQSQTAIMADPLVYRNLIASQCHPSTVDAVPADQVTLWHMEFGTIEDHFPPARRAKGGYALIGGGVSVGNSAMCVAYAMGFRTFEVFGYDSSHRDGKGHAYSQTMNDLLSTFPVRWSDRVYWATITMRAQADKFQITGQALKQMGCTINVHGDGLLPAMWRTPVKNMTERDKYHRMWEYATYRMNSPGEDSAQLFVDLVKPDSLVIDFGAGTGRGALAIHKLTGQDVLLIDFADNCRDHEAAILPFTVWDLTHPIPARAHYGYCVDVLEHIPPADVDTVIANIMESAETVFFQIATVDDRMGGIINQVLHLTVEPGAAWLDRFRALGFTVHWAEVAATHGQAGIKRTP